MAKVKTKPAVVAPEVVKPEVKDKTEQRDRLGQLWLDLMEAKLTDKSINATEQAILARVLIQSGWNIDPTRLPKGLRDKLTEGLDLTDPATAEELGIVGKIA